MSDLPPSYHLRHDFITTRLDPSLFTMAISHPQTKPKPAAGKANAAPKTKSQMHRRSRTGCYTCRLRRKKCDEGTPLCTACRHLGLACEYKRPMWWSNNEARRKHKEEIKMIIKRKKLSEKSSSHHHHHMHPQQQQQMQQQMQQHQQQQHHHQQQRQQHGLPLHHVPPPHLHHGHPPPPHHQHQHQHHHASISTSSSINSPPGLSHSLPTPATFSTDPLDRTRSGSIESHYSQSFGFASPPAVPDFAAAAAGFGPGCGGPLHPDLVFFSPYEIDVKTERQMFIDDVPTLHESTVSTFSAYSTSASTATATSPPPPSSAGTMLHSVPLEGAEWDRMHHQHQHHQHMLFPHERRGSLAEEALDLNFFDFAHGDPAVCTDTLQVAIELDEPDQRLLDHFIRAVMPHIFPILEANQHGSVAADLILPALQGNRGYLHCCLSIAAQHIKSTTPPPSMGSMMTMEDDAAAAAATEDVDQTIMRHRYETVSTLCEALNRDEDHGRILEAALGQIFLQCLVGRPEDSLPDIAWHKHFEAAVSLVQKLDLPRAVADPASSAARPPFNMTLTAWIDILGATVMGRSPTFAHTYREKLINPDISSLGLRELMGCSDRVMYLISEIACLDALKRAGMDDITLCHHVHTLGEQIGLTEDGSDADNDGGDGSSTSTSSTSTTGSANISDPLRLPFNAGGALSPKQLARNVTAAFRLAARIYLCSLVPGFSPGQESCVGLVDRLTQALRLVPAAGEGNGGSGFDRSLVWPFLIGGSVSLPGSSFRALLAERLGRLGSEARLGALGRVAALLEEVWAQTDAAISTTSAGSCAGTAVVDARAAAAAPTPPESCGSDPSGSPARGNPAAVATAMASPEPMPYVHWRDVMQMKGWDFLVI